MRILTGDRPTGALHLGHFVGSLQTRVLLQERPGVEQYILIADMQALTDDPQRAHKLKGYIHKVVCDYLAVGLDPYKSTLYIQSLVPEISELTCILLNLVSVARLSRNPTVKTEIAAKGFEESMPAGFLMYPVSQAADILLFCASHVPVGEDQIPMIEQTNEIARAFNRTYDVSLFNDVEAIVPRYGRLMGIDGKAKMGKTLNNAIFLSDEPDIVAAKVMSMYTDPFHIRAQDPGKVEGNVVFSYLDVFDDRVDEITELKEHYKKGGLGDVTLKKRLIEVLNNFLNPIREKRKLYSDNVDVTMKYLLEGSARAQSVARNTMSRVRKAMKIDY